MIKTTTLPAWYTGWPLMPGAHERNTSLEWYHSDSPAQYDTIKKGERADWWANTTPISYQFNSWGYRSPYNYTRNLFESSVVLIGCSQTLGVGLPWAWTVGERLSEMINKPVINLGVAASSPKFAWAQNVRLAQWVEPLAVVNLWSGSARTCDWTRDGVEHLGPWTDLDRKQHYKTWIANATAVDMDVNLMVSSVDLLWAGRCASLALTPFNDTHTSTLVDYVAAPDAARDGGHWGPVTARLLAEYLAEALATT